MSSGVQHTVTTSVRGNSRSQPCQLSVSVTRPIWCGAVRIIRE